MGGDITGRTIAPVVEQGDNKWKTTFAGTSYSASNKQELEDVKKKARAAGFYPYITNKQEFETLKVNPEKYNQLLDKLMIESMERWIKLAEERLKDTEIKCFISAGNNDVYKIDSILEGSEVVIHPDEKVLMIDDVHEMLSIGKSNMTPWNCPRDVTEDELSKHIESLASQVNNMKKCIFNIHVPPFGTGIDQVPELDENLKPKRNSEGGFVYIPAGSTAVRDAIEKYKPLLGLHGHIHESKGSSKIGKTLCINPGSAYTEGILRGFLCDLPYKKGVKESLFTSG